MTSSAAKNSPVWRLVLIIGLALGPGCARGFSAPTIQILSEGVDLVAYPEDLGKIKVSSTDPVVYWLLRDASGGMLGQGSQKVEEGIASVIVPTRRPGYYSVELNNQAGTARATTSWLILRKPTPGDPDLCPIGVMTHFAQGWDVSLVQIMRKTGIVNARDEAYWDAVEATPKVFAWPSRFEDYAQAFHNAGVRWLLPLTFENRNYDSGYTPFSESGLKGYAEYARQTVLHFAADAPVVEVWNEYNGSFCSGPAAVSRPESYTRLLQHAYPAIKAARPSTVVVGGVTVGVPFPYFERMFKAGALPFMDAISVHPYRYSSPPEGMETDIAALDTLVRSYNRGVSKPIWVSEIGWGTQAAAVPGDLVIDEKDQAKFLVRAFALLASAGVQRSYWYLLRDYDTFATMGLVRGPADLKGSYGPKPVLGAFAVTSRFLTGAQLVRKEATDAGVYSILFKKGGGEMRVMWSLRPVSLTVKCGGNLRVTAATGEESTVVTTKGKVNILLTDTPVFVESPPLSLPAPAPVAKVLADATADFSGVQGQKGWYYGVYAPGSGSGDHFTLMPTYRTTDYRSEWADGAPYAAISSVSEHPGTLPGVPVPTVRRWVSTYQGKITIAGEVQRGSSAGDGVDVRVVVDAAAPLFAVKLGGGRPSLASYSVPASVHVGSKVDFVVDPGPAADVSYDETQFSAVVSIAK